MNRRRATLMCSITTCLVLGLGVTATAAPKWNVLFIASDDMRPDLGCYGNPLVKSPNVDALAKSGVRFDRAYVQYPLCNPSRSSMLTGRSPLTTNVLDNRTWVGGLHPDFITLPRHFQNNGYAALRTGKIFHGGIDDVDAWTEGGERRQFEGNLSPAPQAKNRQQNSDRIVTLDGDGESHGDYKTADRAIDYLRRFRDQPFFLACGFTKPHSPPTAPQKFFDLYEPSQIPLPVDFAARPAAPAGFPKPSITPNGDLFIGRDATEDEARAMIEAYWSSISWTDWNVGRVIAELDKQGLRDKTVIVFWGDHGYHLGEKGKWSKHGSLYEIGTRVPLIIAVPEKTQRGATTSAVVQTVDLYPTLCELCGLPRPTGLEGHSLVPLLNDPKSEWSHPAFSVAGNAQKLGVAIRTAKYRYAEYDAGNAGRMLFDVVADPRELKNLADDPAFATIQSELSQRVKQYITGPRGP